MARFHRPGITQFYFLLTIASAAKQPTVAEVTAGTRLDDELFEINGFSFGSTFIDTPVMRTKFVPKITGREESDDSTLRFYEHKPPASNPIRDALATQTSGFVVIFPGGPVGASVAAGDTVDVWPVTIGSNSKQYTAENEAAAFTVAFAPTGAPAENVAVLA